MVYRGDSYLDPATIVARMRDVYASCESYMDSGYILSVHDGDHERKRIFTTAFRRGDRFRFEFESSDQMRYVIFMDKNGVRSWWDRRQSIEYFSAINQLLAKTGGVSGRTSCIVPALLLQDYKVMRPFTLFEGIHLLEESVEAGKECYRIRGTFSVVGPKNELDQRNEGGVMTCVEETLFVCKSQFLLVRIDDRIKSKRGGVTEMTIVYSPELNAEVSDTQLAFEFV